MNEHKTFGLILIGDELLSGRRADKHLPKVIEMLGLRGYPLSWMHCIGDDPDRITMELKQAFASGDIVFCCGGIGSTPDDHTRQCAARALNLPLALHPQAQALILERAREVALEKGQLIREDSPEMLTRLNMGVFAQGASIIPNPYNKIPGFSLHDVHFFPGFPVMAWPMMEWVLTHIYADLPRPAAHAERSVRVYGIGEAALTPLMEQIECEYAPIKVFSLPSVDHPQYGVHIELGIKGELGQVDQVFDLMLAQLRNLGAELGV